jgi:DNA-binding response OmpR family regulator
MDTILLVDVDPERADLICSLLNSKRIPAKRCQNVLETREMIDSQEVPAVIVVHCDLVNHAFTELARLRHHPKVKLIFYCTDQSEKIGGVAKLPEELCEIIMRITESRKTLLKVS